MTVIALPPRGMWPRCLLAVDRTALAALVDALLERYEIRHRRVPQSGLALLDMREPNRGQRFFLGELPLTCVELELHDGAGCRALGAAQVMHDDRTLVEHLAVCDAVLAGGLPESDRVAELLRAGQERLAAEERQRRGLLERTTVAFDLLEEDA